MDRVADRWRIVTMFGEVVGEGADFAEATLEAAVARHDGMTVVIPPGEGVEQTLSRVVEDLTAEFGDGLGAGGGEDA